MELQNIESLLRAEARMKEIAEMQRIPSFNNQEQEEWFRQFENLRHPTKGWLLTGILIFFGCTPQQFVRLLPKAINFGGFTDSEPYLNRETCYRFSECILVSNHPSDIYSKVEFAKFYFGSSPCNRSSLDQRITQGIIVGTQFGRLPPRARMIIRDIAIDEEEVDYILKEVVPILKKTEWAKPILEYHLTKKVLLEDLENRENITLDQRIRIASVFFELNIANIITLAGFDANYEYRTVDKKSVDFEIPNKALIELTVATESEAANKHTFSNDEMIVTISDSNSTSHSNELEEMDIIKIQRSLITKAEQFKTITTKNKLLHIILLNPKGTPTIIDKYDFYQIIFGAKQLPEEFQRRFYSKENAIKPGSNNVKIPFNIIPNSDVKKLSENLIVGVFDPEGRDEAKHLRESIHVIGFVRKGKFCLFINPKFCLKPEQDDFLKKLFDKYEKFEFSG